VLETIGWPHPSATSLVEELTGIECYHIPTLGPVIAVKETVHRQSKKIFLLQDIVGCIGGAVHSMASSSNLANPAGLSPLVDRKCHNTDWDLQKSSVANRHIPLTYSGSPTL